MWLIYLFMRTWCINQQSCKCTSVRSCKLATLQSFYEMFWRQNKSNIYLCVVFYCALYVRDFKWRRVCYRVDVWRTYRAQSCARRKATYGAAQGAISSFRLMQLSFLAPALCK